MATTANVTWLSPAPATNRAPRGRVLRVPSLRAMWQAARTRRILAQMDDRMLADIGIGRGDAQAEYSRMPWDSGLR